MNKIKILLMLFMLVNMHFLASAGDIVQVTKSTRHLVPAGKSMDAIDGDWIMKNDKVVAVIGQASIGREVNMRVQSVQGAVIDFTSLADNNDYLAAFYPHGYPQSDSRRNPAVFAHKIEMIKGKGNEIILKVTRDITATSAYQTVTEYILKDGENFLRIKTKYTNPGSQDVAIPISDKIRMDMDTEDATIQGKHKLAFIYNKWFYAAYGLYSPTDLYLPEKPVTGSEPGTGLLVAYHDNKKGRGDSAIVKPGGMMETERYLMYGKDVAELQRISMAFGKSNLINTNLKITDTNKKSLSKVFVEVLDADNKLASFAITDVTGTAKVPLPAGAYTFRAAKIGHDTVSGSFTVGNNTREIAATMNPLTSITFTIRETGLQKSPPVKLEFKGINGTSDPFLGSSKRAEGAGNFYYAINKGSFEVPIAPGSYLVIISHGPEYKATYKNITIKPGESQQVSADVSRMFSTPGWVIADFHNHSTISGDNDTETRSRIINLAGAGIEFAPATEHNRISSYTDEIRRLKLDEYLSSAAGIELTGPTGVSGGPNHQNAIFLTVQEGKQGGGFPGISADVYTQMKGIYDYDNGKTKFIQHNHPGMGIPMLYFDKNQDEILDEGFNTRGFTDAIELQTFVSKILDVTSEDAKDKNSPVFYWLQMLNQGDRIFATTTSDSHNVGDGTGSRFMYVYSKNDNPPSIDEKEIMINSKKGRMIVTNGPYLKTDINGYHPGDDIKKPSSGLKMSIEVSANNEMKIDRVQVLINGRQDKNYNFSLASHPALFSDKALQFKHSFPLNLDNDANVIVVATGTRVIPEGYTNSNSRRGGPQIPMAIANPFFVDTNGNGFVANKDTLGAPLPVSKKRAGRVEDVSQN